MNEIARNQEFEDFFDDEKQQMSDFAEEFLKNIVLSRQLVLTPKYINWLEKFTSSHPTFCDDEWKYFPGQIEPENLAKVKLLPQFFDGVEMYSGGKCQQGDKFRYSILIMFNHIGYKIGVQDGLGCYHFCERVEISQNESSFIDFNNIMKEANYY